MEKEEVIYKNTSKMDAEEIAVFQNSVTKKSIFWTSICFVLIFAGMGIGLSFIDLTLGIILIVCGLIGGFVLLPYLFKENMKKTNKEMLGDKKYLNTFDFYHDYFNVASEASPLESTNFEVVGSQKIYYKDLHKVVVYKERLFVFINPRQSFILNFKGMTKGTAGELIELFKSNNIKVKDQSLKG